MDRALPLQPEKCIMCLLVCHGFLPHSSELDFVLCRELLIQKGDIVDILKKVDANWYEAHLNGRFGIVPVTYVLVSI